MVNNVGRTNQTLDTRLGRTTTFESSSSITLMTGELGTGCLIFDSAGTLGVISTFTSENDFIVTTYALSIDITSILNLGY